MKYDLQYFIPCILLNMTAEMCLLLTSVLIMGHFRTRGSGHKLTRRRFPLNIRKHYNCKGDRALAEVAQIDCGSFEIFTSHLDTVLL